VLALVALGCGSGPTLTASEFVDRVNQQGVSMELGRRLPNAGGARELYAVRLPPLPGEPPPAPGSGSAPGASGSLYVYGDAGGAGHELRACRSSGGLSCFQAGNIAVVLEGSSIETQRLAEAIQRLR
jgi:hypothetical protein